MGDLANDTAVRPRGDECYEATLSADWEIWGRWAGTWPPARCGRPGRRPSRPGRALFSCRYLGVPGFGPVDLRVEARRSGRTATSQRVEVTQEGRPILDAMVWSGSSPSTMRVIVGLVTCSA